MRQGATQKSPVVTKMRQGVTQKSPVVTKMRQGVTQKSPVVTKMRQGVFFEALATFYGFLKELFVLNKL